MSLTRRTTLALFAALPVVLATRASAAEPQIFQKSGLALGGTDPLGYFDTAAPRVGLSVHAQDWMGATWQFASEEARARFAAAPEAAAPAFGGYCAYAASLGYLAPTIPEAWTVFEGKLYLNASLRARALWLADTAGNIAKGEANWPAILG